MTGPVPPYCEVCGREQHVALYPDALGGEYLCPEHSASRALEAAASAHLVRLIEETTAHWARHWGQTGMPPASIAEALDFALQRAAAVPLQARREQVYTLLKEESHA